MLREHLLVALYGLAVIAMLVFALSCGGGGGAGDGSPDLLIGGGPTRHWRGRDHGADARALAAHGGSAMVLELNECVRGEQRRCRRTPDEWCPDPAEAARRAKAMRAHGIATLVIGSNANGCLEQELAPEQIASLIEDLRAELGSPDGVILEAVSEVWNAGDLDVWRLATALVRDVWPGELAMPTRSGGGLDLAPAFPEIPHEWIDTHPATDAIALRVIGTPGVIVLTDHRGMMDVGPVRARPLIRRAIETGGTLVFYGGPGQTTLDATLAVIGEEIPR